VYFHGTPSSASEARWLDSAAWRNGVRPIAFDRPGYLASEAGDDRSLVGGARDALSIADELQLDHFAAVGFSGGAGYALALAQLAPQRVTVVHLAGGIAPLAAARAAGGPLRARRLALGAAARTPWLLRPLLAGALRLNRRGLEKRLHDPRAATLWFFDGPAKGAQVEAVAAYVEATDQQALAADLRDMVAAVRATDAVLADLAAYARDWPFDIGAITTPVELWHGCADPAVPAGDAQRLADALPHTTLHLFDGEGHFVIHTHADEIAHSIRERAP
jgi:pimeloyl-ACP methyl ester carboxylesterase